MEETHQSLKLKPTLLAEVRKFVEDWEPVVFPCGDTFTAKKLAERIGENCPKITTALHSAGILGQWAQMLNDQIENDALNLRKSGIAPNEARCQVEDALIPWNLKLQEEWLAANCVDYDPEECEEPEYSRPLLKLREDHLWIRDTLDRCIRTALQRRDMPAETIMRLGAMLWLVEQLPQHCEECTAILSISQDRGAGVASWEIRFDEEGLTLETNQVMRGEWGTDYNSNEILKVTHTKWSTGTDDDPNEWLDQICKKAGKPDYEVSVEWYPEYHMPGEEA